MDNEAEAKEFGIDHLPTLVYFEENIPAIYEGDLMNEDEVLEWLIEQKNSATIEEVTDEILTELIEEHEYVVVYFSKEFLIYLYYSIQFVFDSFVFTDVANQPIKSYTAK